MKIVNVCRRFDPAHWGGTETVVAETGARLASRGHEVSVLASAALGAPGQVEVAGLAVERFR
ncbi:MAG TPA: glycosyltransferase family 1 protein, partial [Planctomycetes bacterium]|nr:glycosyltransferase family 1 protein [Planctomycetota bacterium]